MKIATWNVNSIRVRLPQVLDWAEKNRPDLLCLQETKLPDADFPADDIKQAGYQVVFSGQKTYNGVAIMSRISAKNIVVDLPKLDDPQRRVLGADYGDLRILNLYVPNGQSVGSDKYAYKLAWLEKLKAYVAAQLKEYPNFIALGDFNIAPTDEDVHDPEAWRGSVLCSDAERAAFKKLLDLGLKDSYRLFEQEPGTFSWWDYRAAAFRRNMGLRIDHILCSKAVSKLCAACYIDKTPRGWERPSDHAPVVAEISL